MSKLIRSIDKHGNTQEFNSIAEAAEYHKCNESSIRKVLDKSDRYSCGKQWIFINDTDIPILEKVSQAKVLILDIETVPLKVYAWALYDQNIYIDQIISEWFMLSYSVKWLGEEEACSEVLTPEEVKNEDDFRLVKSLWEFLDEADIVIAHHGDKFDLPKIRSRFIVHEMIPPSSYKQIDTKKIASRQFGFTSNKLEALARLLGLDGKNKTEFNLWVRCLNGDEDALEEMRMYNVQDIFVLEEVYLKLRPYITGHPNLDLYIDSDESVCPSCGKSTLEPIKGKFFYTQAVRYQLYRCTECGAICRAKKGTPYINKKNVSAIPR
jgi:DNA polymerase elongation subunit (family B)